MAEIPFYPMVATGQVFCASANGQPEYTGSCAAYARRNVVITAGHCVRAPDAQYWVALPAAPGGAWAAQQVIRHETSDIAVVVGPASAAESGGPRGVYSGIDQTLVDGGDFIAFGYPSEEGAKAVGRLFRGHFQRHFGYSDPSGRSYFAGEMSIPAPAGLSGGPLSRPHTLDKICAIVTTNHDSYLVIDSYEEEERDGKVSRGKITRVVSYGIAAMFTPTEIGDWLQATVDDAG